MTINKQINTNVVEQVKSALIIAFVVGTSTFWFGMQVQKSNTPTIENKVVVKAVEKVSEQAPLK